MCVILPVINSYQHNVRYNEDECVWPSGMLLWQLPRRAKCLLASQVFSYGSYILVSIYATTWMTLSLFEGSPQGAKFVVHRRAFDLGISWGALDMLILTIVSIIVSIIYSYNLSYEKLLWGISNLLAGVGLCFCYYFDDDTYTFGFLLMCSLSFTTALIAPARLSTEYDKKFTKVCTMLDIPHTGKVCKGPEDVFHIPPYYITQWEKLLEWATKFSRFIALCLIPIVITVFPHFDDSRWSLKISAVWSLLSAFFSIFI